MDKTDMDQNSGKHNGVLSPEDYAEPSCLLCGTPYGMPEKVKRVPLQRIIEKMDEYQSRKDISGAQRHLNYWLEEARLGHDKRGELSIRNEMIGFSRKNGKKEQAFESIEEAVRLIQELELEGSVTSGTTYINAATAYYTFGEYDQSLFWFTRAKAVYEANEGMDPSLLAGLYNNMALTCTAKKQYDKSAELYRKALAILEPVPGAAPERAITCLNLADALEAKEGTEAAEEEIYQLLDRAEELLDQAWEDVKEKNRSEKGYYAFVCESCAPSFSYHGFFMTAEELKKRAAGIYEENAGADTDPGGQKNA